MKSQMNRLLAIYINPCLTDISDKLSGYFIDIGLKNSKGRISGASNPSEKYSNLAIDKDKKALLEKYAKF